MPLSLRWTRRGLTGRSSCSVWAWLKAGRSEATGHLADADAARLQLELHRPQRGEQRPLSSRDGWNFVCVPVGCTFPGAGEILPVQVADAVVVFLGAGFTFAAAVMQD